ncbi:hypothetical protein BTS2_3054 [Bacillus sp. TS-2]|nr:hypothetical protein BTS2_3054 [Bacillus sp. TS-2]
MSIYQHFREEERSFVDQVLSWQKEVKYHYSEKLTDFLDPRQQEIIQLIIGNDDEISLAFFGGIGEVERKRAFLAPPYIEVNEESFDCTLFELNYPVKFLQLQHRDILGSLMAIGLKREKFGDIFIKDERIQFITAKEVASFVEVNVTSIGKASVKLQQQPFVEQLQVIENWSEASGTLSSLRLDAVISEIYRLSRSKVDPLLKKGYVKVNWKVIESGSYQLTERDHLSVRSYGRSQLLQIEGTTKKGKIRISYRLKK